MGSKIKKLTIQCPICKKHQLHIVVDENNNEPVSENVSCIICNGEFTFSYAYSLKDGVVIQKKYLIEDKTKKEILIQVEELEGNEN